MNPSYEYFLLALLFTMIVMALGSVTTISIGMYLVKFWFTQREEYVKRMSMPDHQFETSSMD